MSDPTTFSALGFFPADHAAAESGKVYASGAYWSTLRFPSFPAALPGAALVAVLEQPFHAAHADHEFLIAMEDADGQRQALEIRGEFRAAPGIDSRYGEPNVIPITVPLYGLPFDAPGDYVFVLEVDGAELARYPIHVLAA
ncbi:MAG: hypothetical protein JWN77_1612 [Frankiales bacterium]|nr:hypothetical protein [Frankiales bacterium]